MKFSILLTLLPKGTSYQHLLHKWNNIQTSMHLSFLPTTLESFPFQHILINPILLNSCTFSFMVWMGPHLTSTLMRNITLLTSLCSWKIAGVDNFVHLSVLLEVDAYMEVQHERACASNLPVLVKLPSRSIVPIYSPINYVCKYLFPKPQL